MIRAAVVGASGYSGAEVLGLLSRRDDVVITSAVAASSAGKRIDEVYPAFAGRIDGAFGSLTPDSVEGTDVVFVALPSGEAMKAIPSLIQSAGRVIDLSGDFRLQSRELYESFYPHEHTAFDLVSGAVYGLPELNKEAISSARFVANPGCYATSIILALYPLLRERVISPEGIVVSSMSGVSGAGRSASVDLSFSEINENIRAYKVPRHQHIPEVESVLSASTGADVRVSFIPHLVPITRGIYTTISARLEGHVTDAAIADCFATAYAGAPFVRYRKGIPQIAGVVRTNFCDIGCVVDQRTNSIVIMSVIDNLLKGAAGQAVQNMNLMFGLPETKGLP